MLSFAEPNYAVRSGWKASQKNTFRYDARLLPLDVCQEKKFPITDSLLSEGIFREQPSASFAEKPSFFKILNTYILSIVSLL